jgi:hypothetical protein
LDFDLVTLELLGPGASFWGDGPDLHQKLGAFRDRRPDGGQAKDEQRPEEEDRCSHGGSF